MSIRLPRNCLQKRPEIIPRNYFLGIISSEIISTGNSSLGIISSGIISAGNISLGTGIISVGILGAT